MAVKRNKVDFESNGIKLAGLLESSDSDAVRAYALFAHCFTAKISQPPRAYPVR